MTRILLWLIIVIVLTGCSSKTTDKPGHPGESAAAGITVKYARGFRISNQDETTTIIVTNPWQHASGIEYKYLLGKNIDRSRVINEFSFQIKTPVKKVVCLSTTHIGFLAYIDELASVTGVSGKGFIVNRDLTERISQGSIVDVGYDENLNYELLLKLNPDVVFAYGVNVAVTGMVKKLSELGIPVVMIGEYLEEDPLAKMEWIKVFAAFYAKEPEIGIKFDAVAGHYHRLVELALKSDTRPGVLLGLPWRGTWYISGAQSYMARLLKDAGGKYIMDHLDYNESRPMALEEIYQQALAAEYWINPGDAREKKDILSVDERFGNLPAFQRNNVYNNNNILNRSGGNAFFESGVVEPEIILSDLIYILHPHLLPSHTLKYYRKLQ